MTSAALVMMRAESDEPFGDRALVVAVLEPALADPRQQEDLVVHREPERHGEDERRHDRLDVARARRSPSSRASPTGRRRRGRRTPHRRSAGSSPPPSAAGARCAAARGARRSTPRGSRAASSRGRRRSRASRPCRRRCCRRRRVRACDRLRCGARRSRAALDSAGRRASRRCSHCAPSVLATGGATCATPGIAASVPARAVGGRR